MSQKPVHFYDRASAEIRDVAEYYMDVSGRHTVLDLKEDLEKAIRHIARAPGSGSPRYRRLSRAGSLRFWKLTRFPHLMFYTEHSDDVRVLRVIHGMRDIPRRLTER